MHKIRKLQLFGSPYEMGYRHGQAYADDIVRLTEERVRLAAEPFWNGGRQVSHADVLALGAACLPYHEAYAPELMAEIRGLADATGLGVNELIIMNGFTDFVDVTASPQALDRVRNELAPAIPGVTGDGDGGGCTAFVVDLEASGDGRGYVGQTWDMNTSATPYVLMLDARPEDAPAFMTFTITGCVGMIGMNEHGVAVGINNLVAADGRPGVHWPFVVRKMLAQSTVEDALAALSNAPLSGAHNYAFMGPGADGKLRGYQVERMATRQRVTPVETVAAHTNHCMIPALQALERDRAPYSLASTRARFQQADHILRRQQGRITVDTLMEMTRHHEADGPSICAHAVPEYDVESAGACIMSPTTRELWAVWGQPCENEYERFVVERDA